MFRRRVFYAAGGVLTVKAPAAVDEVIGMIRLGKQLFRRSRENVPPKIVRPSPPADQATP